MMKRLLLASVLSCLPLSPYGLAADAVLEAGAGTFQDADQAAIRKAKKKADQAKKKLEAEQKALRDLEAKLAGRTPNVNEQTELAMRREAVEKARKQSEKAQKNYAALTQPKPAGDAGQPRQGQGGQGSRPAPQDRPSAPVGGANDGAREDRRSGGDRAPADQPARGDRAPTDQRAGDRAPSDRRADGDRAPEGREPRGDRRSNDEHAEGGEHRGDRDRAPGQEAAKVSEVRRMARQCFQAERQHRERIAKIDRLMEVYRKEDRLSRVEELEVMRERQIKRHERGMDAYRREMGPEAFAVVQAALEVGRERAPGRGQGKARSTDDDWREVRDLEKREAELERERAKRARELERERAEQERERKKRARELEREGKEDKGKGKGKGRGKGKGKGRGDDA